jgi:hypothetical protein
MPALPLRGRFGHSLRGAARLRRGLADRQNAGGIGAIADAVFEPRDHDLMTDTPNDPAAAASGPTPTPATSAIAPEVLKSAYNAFKKRWKLTRLDQESRIGRGPMSSGQKSTIAGIVPPDQFPREVWEELVKAGRIKRAGSGFYSLP